MRKVILGSLLLIAALLVGPNPTPHAAGVDSSTYLPRSNPVYAASWVGVQNGGGGGVAEGHVGMDVWLNQPNLNGGQDYLPCQNINDSAISACWRAGNGGYAQVLDYCYPPHQQWDGQVNVQQPFRPKSAGFSLEIYPYSDPASRNCGNNWQPWSVGYDLQPGSGRPVYGGLRVVVTSTGANLGLISTPQSGNAGTGSLNGFLCHSGAYRPPSCPNGNPAPDGSLSMSWFGLTTVTNRSSTGYPVASFGAWHNQSADTGQPGSNSGYYTSGPLISGGAVVFVAGHRCTVNVGGYGGRLDFNLDDAWLGHRDLCSS